MNFRPVELKENHNINKGSRVKDLFVLLGGVLLAIIILYYLSGLLVDLIAPHLPEKMEKSINSQYRKHFMKEQNDEALSLQSLVDSLVDGSDRDLDFCIVISRSTDVNAFAVPGGIITLNRGLIDFADSRQELAFVIAHELGHFQHYDHTKGIGRGLIAGLIISFFTGKDNTVAGIMNLSAGSIDLKFSRRQESAADRYAVQKLIEHYGNADGAVSFLRRMSQLDNYGKFTAFFSTHPHPEKRLEQVIDSIK